MEVALVLWKEVLVLKRQLLYISLSNLFCIYYLSHLLLALAHTLNVTILRLSLARTSLTLPPAVNAVDIASFWQSF